MARRDRSPSPAGSHASSRRSHRRSRSPDVRNHSSIYIPPSERPYHADNRRNPQKRYRDDRYRRNDRYETSHYRRDRSRDRYRSPDRRDRRHRSRERDVRRADDAYDKSSSRRSGKRDDVRDSDERRQTVSSPQKTEEEKQVELQARLQEWKKKRAAKQESSQPARAKAEPRSSAEQPKRSAETEASYPGKFDPKVIAKKSAAATSVRTTLGGDVAVPSKTESASTDSPSNGLNADHSKASAVPRATVPTSNSSSLKPKAGGNVGRFGFGSRSNNEIDKIPAKAGLDLGEEGEKRRKLEKLPTPPPEEAASNDSTLANVPAADGELDDQPMEDASTEEEMAAAARAALEKREDRLNAERAGQVDSQPNVDTVMTDAPNGNVVAPVEEEIDPLDAFMNDLGSSAAASRPQGISATLSKKPSKSEELFEEEDEFSTMQPTNPDELMDIGSKKKKREMPQTDHTKTQYEAFRKNFYVEPTEYAEMTEEEVADLRLELDGIKVRGVDVPRPVTTWSQFGLGVQSLDVINELGYEKPTSIQAQAIPAIMSGRDVIGIAKTGSGKTIAFLLPMFRHIKDQPPLDSRDGPIGVVLTPTRELATQIHKECRPWLKALGLRAVCCYGGAPIKDQIAELKRGAEIVVATAGRFIDLLAANSGRVTNLRRTTYVVLDEADRMFDMGFEPQVMKIMNNIRPDRQSVMFSATFPRNMEALARKVLTRPVEILVGGRSTVAPEIEQIVEVRNDDNKFKRLLQLLAQTHEDDGAASLVFVDRQESAEDLMNAIMKRGYPSNSLHGGKDQHDRDDVISSFKAGVFPVLVATSVAARGLDVKHLKLVVNFDCPNHLEDYVHRVGRTGRAGNKGTAVTFVTEDQGRFASSITKALTMSGLPVPPDLQKLVESFNDKVKSGEAKTFKGSGFGGRGMERFEQRRDAQRSREKRAYKAGDDAESDKEEDKAKEEEPLSLEVKPATKTESVPMPKGLNLDEPIIKVHKRELPAAGDQMGKVTNAAAAINARLRKSGDIRGNAPIDNKGPDAGAFHSTLEINDYPQKARWAVTNRTNVAKILEATGTSITSKGNYYSEGQLPGPTDPPKLYILVEGDTEMVVTQAMRELMRLLREGIAAAVDSEARAPAKSGRYQVL